MMSEQSYALLGRITIGTKTPRKLFWDIENRPLSYWYDGNPTAQVTAIAWALDDGPVYAELLTKRMESNKRMLREFSKAYAAADILIGHNIRRHDLPIALGALIEMHLEPIGPKLTQDTLRDLPRWKDIPKSLEYLGAWLGIDDGKEHMTQAQWRRANRLEPDGIEETRRRVESDVMLTRDVYNALMEKKLLKRPRMWRP